MMKHTDGGLAGLRREEQVARVLERLDQVPGLLPVAEGEGRLFCAHDLASLTEVAFGETLDPHTMTDADAADLARRLDCPHQVEDEHRRRYWIIHGGQTVGTVAVDNFPVGLRDLKLSSLFLQPEWRGLGLGRAVVDTVSNAAAAERMGALRLDADWLRPQAISFYLHLGFQVTHWKHAIHMVRRPGAPRLRYQTDGTYTRRLLIDAGGGERLLWTAARDGDWLRLRSQPGEPLGPLSERDALATLAIHLALEGFPLIRDAEHWNEAYRWSEGGEPEGLARRIWFFEEYTRRHGHRIDTPTQVLPANLAWPAWD